MLLLIQYLLKLFISLAIIWLFYQLVLRRLTFYNSNRWYLLGCTLLAFFIPFINIAPMVNSDEGTGAVVRLFPTVQQYICNLAEAEHRAAPVVFTRYDKWDWLSFVLMAGTVFFLIRFIIRCISFIRMRRNAKLLSEGKVSLYQVDKDIIPFSFGNSIFINRQLHNDSELQEIIRHEFVHVKQKHTHDIIWGELLCIINWYNPFAWLIRNAIRQNLEFIADNKVLENGLDKKQYQYLLLKVIGNRHFSIANQFNFSSLKKRIAMMNKMKSARPHLLKFLFVLPLVAVLLFAFRSRQIQESKPQDTGKQKDINTAKPVNKKAGTTTYPDTNLWISNQDIMDGKRVTDTIPEELLNDKGYYIEIIDKKGNCTVVVWNKNKKEVARMLLTEWNEKEAYYENLYGEIPPPPPPAPPAPPVPPVLSAPAEPIKLTTPPARITPAAPSVEAMPAPPTPAKAPKLPENVRHIRVHNNKASVTLKDGEREEYDLNDPKEKAAFDKKYPIVYPPAPPVPSSSSHPAPSSDRSKPVKVNVNTYVSPTLDISVNVDEPRKIKTDVNPNLKINSDINLNLQPNINLNLYPNKSLDLQPNKSLSIHSSRNTTYYNQGKSTTYGNEPGLISP